MGCLSLVDEHHLCRMESCHLTDDLGTDGACGTRDQHSFVFQLVFHRLEVDLDLLTRQQVFHAHLFKLNVFFGTLFQLTIFHISLFFKLGHQDLATGTNEDILYFLVVAEVIHTKRTHQDGFDSKFLDNGRQVIVGIEDGNAHEAHVTDTVFVGDESTQFVLRRLLVANAFGDTHAACQGTINEHTDLL